MRRWHQLTEFKNGSPFFWWLDMLLYWLTSIYYFIQEKWGVRWVCKCLDQGEFLHEHCRALVRGLHLWKLWSAASLLGRGICTWRYFLSLSPRLDQMFSDAFSKDHQLIRADPKHSLYLACALMVRGNVQVSDLRRNIERWASSLPHVTRLCLWVSHCVIIQLCWGEEHPHHSLSLSLSQTPSHHASPTHDGCIW